MMFDRLSQVRCLTAVLLACATTLVVGAQERAPAQQQEPPPASAREILATYGIGPAEFSRFVDGGPITPDEEAVLAKILLRFSRLGLDNIHRWRKDGPGDWSQVAAATHRQQGELFALRGRARLVTEHKLPPQLAEQIEFGRYFAVRIALDGSPQQAVVFTRVVPRAWQVGQPLDEPAAADGLLLKLAEADDGDELPLVFAAGRVAWLPQSSPVARAGFDVSLLDAVRNTNGQGLVAADREPFYQLLAAIGRTANEPPSSAPALDLVGLLQQPAEHHGQSYWLRGTARRVVKVPIPDAGLRERLAFDHYYEIDLFVPLGDARLGFEQQDPAAKGPVFENTYPVTLVARRLPAGLSEGENLHAEIAADAVFFKLWTYESLYMARHGRVQPAPLLVAHQPRLVPAAASDSGVWSSAMTAALVGLLVLMLAAWWWYASDVGRRSDSARRTITTRPTGIAP